MRILLIYTILFIGLIGCSADVVQNSNDEIAKTASPDSNLARVKATEHIITGSAYELQGRIADAILEYQEALSLDPQPGVYYSVGKAFLRLNKLSPALKNAQKAVELDGDDIEYNFLLAKIYQIANMSDSAAAVYAHIISLDSLNTGAYYNLGLIYEKDRAMQAIEIFNKILTITGPQWDVLIKIADLNERLGRVNETIKTVEELYELNPTNLDLQKVLIDSYLKTADYEKASLLVEDAVLLYPDDLTLIESKAKIEAMQGNWKKSAEEYSKLVESDEISFEAKIQIGLAFLAQTDKDTVNWSISKKIFEKLDKDTTDWQVKSYLGEIAINNNDDSLAVEYFQAASKLAEWNAPVWIRLGGLLFDLGEYEKAAEEMEKVIKSFPDEYAINLILGLSYSQINKHKKAEPFLRKSVSLNPNDLNAIAAFGFTLNQIKRNDEAIIYLKKALALDPNNIQLLGILGLIYDTEKMYDECDEIYEKAYALDPANALILNNYAYSLAERDLQIERAFEMSRNAVEQDPENPSYLDTLGWIYFKLGDFKKAKEYIEKAIDFDGNDAALYDHLGDVLFLLGEKTKALEFWNKSLKLNPTNDNVIQKIEKGEL